MKNFSTNIPIRILQVLLVACFVLPLAACNKEEAPKAVEKAPVPVPTTDDIVEWRAYVSDVVRRNMGAIANQPYVYLLPGESDGDFEGNYERLAEKAHTDRSEEHTSELKSLMRISYAVFCLQKKKK